MKLNRLNSRSVYERTTKPNKNSVSEEKKICHLEASPHLRQTTHRLVTEMATGCDFIFVLTLTE